MKQLCAERKWTNEFVVVRLRHVGFADVHGDFMVTISSVDRPQRGWKFFME